MYGVINFMFVIENTSLLLVAQITSFILLGFVMPESFVLHVFLRSYLLIAVPLIIA